MSNNLYFPNLIDNFIKENDKALKHFFGKYIKGSFLIEMKYKIIQSFPEWRQYYDLQMNMRKLISGDTDAHEFDICKLIIGCHSSNIIFLADEQRVGLQKSSDYKEKLTKQVIQNIKLRRYGSSFFRKTPISQGELFINYNVPYNMFVVAIRINELLQQKETQSECFYFYSAISNKALAALSLLEDNFLDNSYPICRAIIELYLKLLIFKNNPKLVEDHSKFSYFELIQSCCEQEYPEDFNALFQNRVNKSKSKKIDYLHYGWVDKLPSYHNIVERQPYSINGILTYLKKLQDEDNCCFEEIEYFYKMCHGYTHGNVTNSRFPLLHYFEISIMLHYTLFHTYKILCEELALNGNINEIDIFAKEEEDFNVLYSQYLQRSTEFDKHCKTK